MMLSLNSVDQETIKDSNRKRILQLLSKKRESTKQEIAKELEISIPTVTTNINTLIEEGILEEAGVAESTGGRKPVIVRFLPNSRYSFGVDFSLTSVRIALTNLDSEIIYETSFKMEGFANMSEVIRKIEGITKDILKQKNISADKVLGIGFSLPGTVNEEEMLLEMAPNLKIKNISFKAFDDILEFPVYIENEANAAALAELSLGIAKQMRNLVYVSITKGIGTGIVIQDYLYKGKNKRAGEFGHMTVVADGKQCNCGKKGCWELYASDRALIEQFNKKAGKTNTSLQEIFEALKKDDPNAKAVWQEYLNYLAVGIQNIILILDPHYIVIGGEISQYEEMLEPLKEKIFIENNFYSKNDIKIMISTLKGNASILGASLLPLQSLFFIRGKII
ncbi:ROK family transcriptional regulator [Defluviitalea saccharophila]|uniref:ROK family transcriptional regulator n=1 Tax=Defluviitalea saccharophila TaxID=879970 RepID=A0ABZ2Y1M6_9FIRM